MTDTALVQVLNSADQLPVELCSLLFVEASITDNEIEQLATVGMFHNHEKFLFCLNDFVKLDDVRVSNFLEDLDFSGDSFDVLLVIDFLFLKNFYGNLLSC